MKRNPIAETHYDLDEETVIVRIFAPVLRVGVGREPPSHTCDYEIVGLGRPRAGKVEGVDSLQALVLALNTVAAELYCSAEYREGRLRWFGDLNLGLPVEGALRDLVPPPRRPFTAVVDVGAPDGATRTTTIAANTLQEARATLEARYGAEKVLSVEDLEDPAAARPGPTFE